MRGDIALYEHDDSLVSLVIAKLTGGPMSHVGVQVDSVHSVEAHSGDGVQIRNLVLAQRKIHLVNVRALGATELTIERGLDWVEHQVGSRYSYLDCLDDLPLLRRLGISFAIRDRFDCSNLVGEYILMIGGRLADALYPLSSSPNIISPNDIWRAAASAATTPSSA